MFGMGGKGFFSTTGKTGSRGSCKGVVSVGGVVTSGDGVVTSGAGAVVGGVG
jgi:hypothetical protein